MSTVMYLSVSRQPEITALIITVSVCCHQVSLARQCLEGVGCLEAPQLLDLQALAAVASQAPLRGD